MFEEQVGCFTSNSLAMRSYISLTSAGFSYQVLETGSCTDLPGGEYILDLDDCNEATNELFGKSVDEVNYSSWNWARGCNVFTVGHTHPFYQTFNTNLGGSHCKITANCICKIPRKGIYWNTKLRRNFIVIRLVIYN